MCWVGWGQVGLKVRDGVWSATVAAARLTAPGQVCWPALRPR